MWVQPIKLVETESTESTVSAWLDQRFAKEQINGAALVVRNGEVVYERYQGWMTVEQSRVITPETVFNLASVSKQFTAFAVALLISEGKLQLSDSLSTFFPELKSFGHVSVEQLLAHRSGLPEYFFLASLQSKDWVTNADIISAFSETQPTPKKAGLTFRYTNTNYVLLAELVARVSGQDFESFLKQRLFKPAAMDNTFVGVPFDHPHRAQSFKKGWFGVASKDESPWNGVIGDGGIYTTARDLWRWHQVTREAEIFSEAVLNLVHKPLSFEQDGNANYGFGWSVQGVVLSHAGGWVGHSSYYWRHLTQDSVLILLDNRNNALRVVDQGTRWNSIPLNLIPLLSR